jgi:hypothetical protein
MDKPHRSVQEQVTIARLPVWLRVTGILVCIGSAVLQIRIIWEQTVWTWKRGPQMIGFSLAHGPGALLLLFPFLLIAWTVVVIALSVRSKIKKNRIAPSRWAALGLAVFILASGELPDGFWERMFITRMAASSRAGDLLVYAAYRGDLGTVKDFILHGVPVDALTHNDWQTAMHGAAVRGDVRIARYLVSKGANINALDRAGDSPLELAASNNNDSMVNFLTGSGAKRIRGDEAQRKKAIQDEVSDDIKEMER